MIKLCGLGSVLAREYFEHAAVCEECDTASSVTPVVEVAAPLAGAEALALVPLVRELRAACEAWDAVHDADVMPGWEDRMLAASHRIRVAEAALLAAPLPTEDR